MRFSRPSKPARGYRSSSIDAPGQRDETLADRLGTDDSEGAVVDERSVLAPALAALPERQQEVVRLRFVDGLTQSEIAVRVGISQMHVSRLLAQSMARIRETWPRNASSESDSAGRSV